MQIVYAMDVIDPLARGSARYVRRFTYATREEAWSKYSEAIRFGFEAYVEEVGRNADADQAASVSAEAHRPSI
jgi:hypothetical protein